MHFFFSITLFGFLHKVLYNFLLDHSWVVDIFDAIVHIIF